MGDDEQNGGGGGQDPPPTAAAPADVESAQEMEARQRKEVKNLDGARRTAVKKAKATAGKGRKGKEALAAVEKEYGEKERELRERHGREKAAVAAAEAEGGASSTSAAVAAASNEDGARAPSPAPGEQHRSEENGVSAADAGDDDADAGMSARDKKRSKALRKKQRQREKERQREAEIAEEVANAGPSARDVEMGRMRELYLDKDGLALAEVPADGHCLYRAVAAQVERLGDGPSGYGRMRAMCADTLAAHADEFSPFAELDHHNVSTYDEYVEKVRSSSEWGGQLELRALSRALRRPVMVYSADAPPVTMREEEEGDDGGGGGSSSEYGGGDEPIRLAFHRHYYALGEHYNHLLPRG